MDITIGHYYDQHNKTQAITWTYEPGMLLMGCVGNEMCREQIIGIEPEELLALADAVRGTIKRQNEDKHLQELRKQANT